MTKVLLAHGLGAFESDGDLCYRRLVQQMSFDRNWRIRRQFAEFVAAFLEPLDEHRTRLEIIDTTYNGGLSKSIIKKRFPISERAKQIKKAFKSVLKEVTVEILNDLDDQVAIEGINVLSNYDFLFNKVTMEDEFRQRLGEILSNAIDSRISIS